MLAILPYYLDLLILRGSWNDMQHFTVFRLFRLLRLFRCYTFSSLLQLSIDALVLSVQKSTDALIALVVFLSFIMVAFSTLLYFAERGSWDAARRTFIDVNGDPSQFSSIPASFWFVAEIMTTVGLGDIHPKTTLGKTITVPLMMVSLLIIALPSIVIGRNFAESWAWLRSARPPRRSMTIAPNTTSPATLPLSSAVHSPPAMHLFTQEENNTQRELAHHLTHALDRPLPEASTFEEHGEVQLGILQELQRQNELLERLLLTNIQQSHVRSRPGSVQPGPDVDAPVTVPEYK